MIKRIEELVTDEAAHQLSLNIFWELYGIK